MNWKNSISIHDLPKGKLRIIAEKCGITTAFSLLEKVPGLQIYIPQYGRRKIQKEYIEQNLTGSNMLSIAVHLGIDTTKVRYFSRLKTGYKKPVISNMYMKIIAKKCGKEVATSLIENFPGEHIYIPIHWFSETRKHRIEEEFDGNNSTYLALKYHVSERYIKKVIANYYEKKDKKDVEQMSLFGN